MMSILVSNECVQTYRLYLPSVCNGSGCLVSVGTVLWYVEAYDVVVNVLQGVCKFDRSSERVSRLHASCDMS